MNYGDPQKAIAPREEMAKKDPTAPGNIMSLGQAYLATARAMSAKNDKQAESSQMFAKAKSTFKQGIAKWPDEKAWVIVRENYGAIGLRDALTPAEFSEGKIPWNWGRFLKSELDEMMRHNNVVWFPKPRKNVASTSRSKARKAQSHK